MPSKLKPIRVGGCLAAALLLAATGCGVQWEHSFERGMKRAAQERRKALVQFYALNPACRGMDLEVFTDDEVRERMKDFVPIRLDYYLNRGLADQFGVQVVPTFIALHPDGEVTAAHAGELDVDKFKFFLISCRYN